MKAAFVTASSIGLGLVAISCSSAAGLGFKTGRLIQHALTPHNRLWLSMAHAFGHELKTFGKPRLCEAGPLSLTT